MSDPIDGVDLVKARSHTLLTQLDCGEVTNKTLIFLQTMLLEMARSSIAYDIKWRQKIFMKKYHFGNLT